jgi:hypothetical protein
MDMRKLVWAAVVLAVLANAETARGDELGRTVQDLYTACKQDSIAQEMFCVRYLDGLADLMFQQGSVWAKGDAKLKSQMKMAAKICNANYTPGSLKQIFINWAERNPKKWQQDQSIGAISAFLNAWPCD